MKNLVNDRKIRKPKFQIQVPLNYFACVRQPILILHSIFLIPQYYLNSIIFYPEFRLPVPKPYTS